MTETVGNAVGAAVVEDGASTSFPPGLIVLKSSAFVSALSAFATTGIGRVLMKIDIVR